MLVFGDFDLSDKPRSGRQSLRDDDVGARSFSDNIGARRKASFSLGIHFGPYSEDRIGMEISNLGATLI